MPRRRSVSCVPPARASSGSVSCGFLSSVAPLLVEALFVQGRDEEALQLTERWPPERLTVPEDADAQVGWRRVRAKLLARRGDFEEAERLGREATAIASGTDYLDLHAQALADLAEVLRLAGKPEESAAAVAGGDPAVRAERETSPLSHSWRAARFPGLSERRPGHRRRQTSDPAGRMRPAGFEPATRGLEVRRFVYRNAASASCSSQVRRADRRTCYPTIQPPALSVGATARRCQCIRRL